MKTPVVADMLTRVSAKARDRLDSLDGALPTQQPRVPFEEWLPRAQARAARDPAYAQELRRALNQYDAIRG